MVGARIYDGEAVQTEDGTWWIYDPEEREWVYAGGVIVNVNVEPTRPEVSDTDECGYCPECLRCYGCGELVA